MSENSCDSPAVQTLLRLTTHCYRNQGQTLAELLYTHRSKNARQISVVNVYRTTRSEGNMPFAQRCVSIEKFSCFSFLLLQEPSHFVIMSSITLVLCAAVFYVQFSSCVGTTPNADTKTLCEYKEIQKCNHKFKQVFVNARNSYGPRRLGIYARNRIYCKALQVRCGSRSWSFQKKLCLRPRPYYSRGGFSPVCYAGEI